MFFLQFIYLWKFFMSWNICIIKTMFKLEFDCIDQIIASWKQVAVFLVCRH